MSRPTQATLVAGAMLLGACSRAPAPRVPAAPRASTERVQVLALDSGVTATVVAPQHLDPEKRVELILYALPNGNSTAQTMGRVLTEGMDWHFDIQHIAAQTRALRARGLSNAIVVYLEADTKSWPEWRRIRGYENANARIVTMVDRVRAAVGNPPEMADTLVVLAYDDRNIMLDGKRVITDSTGGTWRASQGMLDYFRPSFALTSGTLGDFVRYRGTQIDFLLHPNPANRILHTEMIGEMNGYMHAMLVRHSDYEAGESVLRPVRAYREWIEP